MTRPALLILGGTSEAVRLAEMAVERFGTSLRIISSLAGRTTAPATPAGEVRSGGFGGVTGLRDYLAAEQISLLVDATHPFAAQISDQAATACTQAGVPRVVLERPMWPQEAGDDWRIVADATEAARTVGSLVAEDPTLGVLLTVGHNDLAQFAGIAGGRWVVRTIEAPDDVRPDATVLKQRGPFQLAGERRLFEQHGIGVLVTRASGGAATAAKLTAARERGIPVVMIDRPPSPPGPCVDSVGQAIAWISGRMENR